MAQDDILRREADGSIHIRESVGEFVLTPSQFTGMKKAQSSLPGGAVLVTQIAGIHEGITKNYTEYPMDELIKSIESWTKPYNKPVITDHLEFFVDLVVGRIINVEASQHAEKGALVFTASIASPDAIDKIADGRYSTVSIGARIESAVCSICGNDWAVSSCDHERGRWYNLDEDDPTSAQKQTTWIIGGVEGAELSFVTSPADVNATVLSAELQQQQESSSGDGSAENHEMADVKFFVANESMLASITDDGRLEKVMDSESNTDKLHLGHLMKAIESISEEPARQPTKEADVKVAKVASEETEVEVTEDLEEQVEEVEETEDDQVAEDAEEAVEDGDSEESPEEESAGSDTSDEESDAAEAVDGDIEESEEDPEAEEVDESDDDSEEDPEAESTDESTDDEIITEDEDVDTIEGMQARLDEISEENRDIKVKLHLAYVTLHVERGLSDGSLEGTREELMAEFLKKDIVDLEDSLSSTEKDPSDVLEFANIVGESEVLGIDSDSEADAEAQSRRTATVRIGGKEKVIEFENEDKNTEVANVRIEPRTRK